jgi:O-acetyl-ADP-ribose deacetylase (regulator of RNase III)
LVVRADEPNPDLIHTLDDLAQAFTRLRRREARPGQVQLSVRDVASRIGKASSTLDPYLRGKRLCPEDVYEAILRTLNVPDKDLRRWLNAWERVADKPAPVPHATQETRLYSPGIDTDARVGLVCGDVRRVRSAEIWINSENTDMRMARFEEHSMSAIIRFWGAVHDDTGRVVEDRIAEELERQVGGRRPVPPGTVITTSAGELTVRNGVRFVIHIASVQGEPGEGYRPVFDLGRCVRNALVAAERLAADHDARTVMFPLLGTGVAGGRPESTARLMVGAMLDHLATRPDQGLRVIYLLATTPAEREACEAAFAEVF